MSFFKYWFAIFFYGLFGDWLSLYEVCGWIGGYEIYCWESCNREEWYGSIGSFIKFAVIDLGLLVDSGLIMTISFSLHL